MYIKKSNKTLYIPSLLVSHDGYALDDKTLFRKCEKVLKKNCKILLGSLGIESKEILMFLGLEQ
jgi:glutamine synthetase type III